MLHNFIVSLVVFYLTYIIFCESTVRKTVIDNKINKNSTKDGTSSVQVRRYHSNNKRRQNTRNSCWTTLNAGKHMKAMQAIDDKFAEARQRYQTVIEQEKIQFNKDILEALLRSRGILTTEQHAIPAGLHLGGYSMVRMPDSILFFHRMKLRNQTIFRINSLDTDLHNMRIMAHLSLNDLHLLGSYERLTTDPVDASILSYAATYGQLEILLKDVTYMVEGRLRLIKDSPYIVLMTTEIDFYDALLTYQNNAKHASKPVVLEKRDIEEFMDRMNSDLDEWLRDYLNELLVFFTSPGRVMDSEMRKYYHAKETEVNNFFENAIDALKNKIEARSLKAVKLPNFTIVSPYLDMTLSDGVLRGLNSIYRRSMPTSGAEGLVRKVDGLVGFSNLKAEYNYIAYLKWGSPPLNGKLVLTSDDLTARMSMSLLDQPENADLTFDSIRHSKPESLTIEGPANRAIANFKHLLENEIISMMSNAVNHNIRSLNSLVKCVPDFFPYVESKETRGGKMKIFEDSLESRNYVEKQIGDLTVYSDDPDLVPKHNKSALSYLMTSEEESHKKKRLTDERPDVGVIQKLSSTG